MNMRRDERDSSIANSRRNNERVIRNDKKEN